LHWGHLAWKVKVRKSATGNNPGRPPRAGGFTLIELILVLAVVSLVLAIAYPSMSRGRMAFHLRGVGRDVINTVRMARETAVTEQKVIQMLIDAQARQVTLSDDVGDEARTYQLPDDVQIQGLTPAGEPLTEEPMKIRFLPNGSSDDALVMLKAESGAVLRIVLDPITGSARMLTSEEVKGP
jgi:general secretion pathway protein H